MVEFVPPEHPSLAAVPGEPALACIIEGGARSCGHGAPGDFWRVVEENGQVSGGIYHSPSGLWATAQTPAAAQEAAQFLTFLGGSVLQTDEAIAANLPCKGEELAVMEYLGEAPTLPQSSGDPTLAALLAINVAAGALPEKAAQELYADFHLRLRRGTAQIFVVADGTGTPAAAAALSFVGSHSALVGYVACRPAMARQGYATTAVAAAVCAAQMAGLRPLVTCRPPLEGFYRRQGWQTIGKNIQISSF